MSDYVKPPCIECGSPDHAAIDCLRGANTCGLCGDPITWDSDKLSCSCAVYDVTEK